MVEAYIKNDKDFYRMSRHYTDHLGIGGSFLSKLISPGKNTLAMSREMDEIFGGYAHIYHFDYSMLKIILSKWGFSKIYKAKFCESKDRDMRNPQCVSFKNKKYRLDSSFVKNKEFVNFSGWYHSGFDKSPQTSLFVECIKVEDKKYSYDQEYPYNKRNRFESKPDKIKLFFIRIITKTVDAMFLFMSKIKNILKFK